MPADTLTVPADTAARKLEALFPDALSLLYSGHILLLMNYLFGMNGIVWTQLIADTFTVMVSYILYYRLKRKEGF